MTRKYNSEREEEKGTMRTTQPGVKKITKVVLYFIFQRKRKKNREECARSRCFSSVFLSEKNVLLYFDGDFFDAKIFFFLKTRKVKGALRSDDTGEC